MKRLKLDQKKSILSVTDNGLEVFRFFISGFKGVGGSMISPLRPDKHPSFSVFKGDSGVYLYNDFGTQDSGDCFKFVQELRGVGFKEAVEIITRELNLKEKMNKVEGKKGMVKNNWYRLEEKEFSQSEADYWELYGIAMQIVRRYGLVAVDNFKRVGKHKEVVERKSSEKSPIFAYKHNGWAKVYQPFSEKRYRFLHLGDKDEDFIFGWRQLPQTGEKVFITGGEKDVLTMVSHGFHAIALNSETARLKEETFAELRKRFREVYVLYDNDQTGLAQSERLSGEYGIPRVLLPEISNEGKDISDFFKEGGAVGELEKLISQAAVLPEKHNPEKKVYTAAELLSMPDIKPEYLMEPIFPRVGAVLIAGKPDTGKSQFARQLCIQVALGIEDFIGFKLKPKHYQSLYVATEDNIDATKYLLNEQTKGLKGDKTDNLSFIFAEDMDQEKIIGRIEEQLEFNPVDIIVIDSFGDIFTGGDTNNNMAMRNTVALFNAIANKNQCLIVFVHHINKGAYRQSPKQEGIQGGSGLVQKVRLAIQLSEGLGDTRYFSVVKGNYCPKELKDYSLELEFSESSFLFRSTGRRIPTSEIGWNADPGRKEDKILEIEKVAEEIFKKNTLRSTEFVTRYQKHTGVSEATAKRVQKTLKESGFIVECEGGYRLSRIKDYDPLDEEEILED